MAGVRAAVTGAAAGLGRAIAAELAARGARVSLLDIDGARCEEAAAAIGARALRCDVSREDEVREAFAAIGELDVLVNSAGVAIRPGLPFTNNSEADWDRAWAVNVKSMVFCAAAVAPGMKARRSGRIVNVGSIAGIIAAHLMPAYSVSKAAVHAFTRTLARELAPHNVTVNAVAPGFIWTELWERLGPQLAGTESDFRGLSAREAFDKRVRDRVPMGRAQTAEDVARAVAFLGSDDAAQITGQILAVDGGVTI
jgi:NAD(P)-dependent dehydrogenase (short-subunit alcohol dehydrogenase family)